MSGASVSRGGGLRVQDTKALQARQHSRPGRLLVTANFKVRPYTVRRGDTLSLIAKKRDVKLDELIKLNHDINPDELVEGQTIILPAGKLSYRDRQILDGIGPRTYRTYPVRAGETLEDIMSKRKINLEELAALNPETNLDKLAENVVLKLPANKYTVREKEMLSGTVGVPVEFFSPGSTFSKWIIVALGAGALYSFWLWRQQEPDDEEEDTA